MAAKEHHYSLTMTWTGNTGEGTKSYQSYLRNHVYKSNGKPEIPGSADPSFRGDASRYNPEELLVATLSSCHMLWYLHLCSEKDIVVESYIDNPSGTMVEEKNGNGFFSEVILKPVVIISRGSAEKAEELHHDAHKFCFIANSVKFPVKCEPLIQVRNQNA
jgi:organic hydroperoxide reductase OsmC/OhrA